MPSAKVHVPASAGAGLLYSLHEARDQAPTHQLVEGIAGTFGGGLGGKLPDLLDPPTSPRHRGHAHSVTLAAALLALRGHLELGVEHLRTEADRWDAEALQYEEWSLDWITCRGVALVLRALAGFLNGLYAGYLCHLGLDVWTPAGLSII